MTIREAKDVRRALVLLTGDAGEMLKVGRNQVQVIYRRGEERYCWPDVESFSGFVLRETRR
jgi:hypothetical protein